MLFSQPGFLFHHDARPVPVAGVLFLVTMAVSWGCASTLVRSARAAHWLQITVVATLQGTLVWTPLALAINSALGMIECLETPTKN